MAHKPSFVPRELLVRPHEFGQDPDALWRYAEDEPGAILLHRAGEQHELARVINLTLALGNFSIPDLASSLHVWREGLWRKLTGAIPTTETDLIRWAWLTGEKRKSYALNDLTPAPVAGPAYPLIRRRKR